MGLSWVLGTTAPSILGPAREAEDSHEVSLQKVVAQSPLGWESGPQERRKLPFHHQHQVWHRPTEAMWDRGAGQQGNP